MIDFLWYLLFGFVVGVVAKLLMPGRDPGGCFITIALGIGGAMLGGYLGKLLGFYGDGHRAGFIASVLGAMLILLIYRVVRGRS